jgi:hypothetical protein
MPAPVVRPEYGPSLPQLLGPRVRALPLVARIAAVLLAGLIVVLAAVSVIDRGTARSHYVDHGSLPFNLSYTKAVSRVPAHPGERVRLEQRRGGLFLASYAVEPLRLPAYSGLPDGIFPAYAEQLKTELAKRFSGYVDVAPEGRVRLNEIATGYSVEFRAKLAERTLYGRAVMISPPKPGQRDTMLLVLLATPAAGISGPDAVGYDGPMTIPYRSFRFGTDRP